ncbi:hypothetical protein AB0M28_22370 [Streptomyces sp. NPDC051940]|uniref:hypothetical protein n=1 Tax=Streptomyces sp. NPDC051940 TaxID=3155675 RepID=UPI003437EE35
MDTDTTSPLRRALRAVAIAACVPYLSLKTAWIAGSDLGIPEGSELLEHRATMAAVNTLTVLMDAAVIVIAFALTRPWGRRAPAWLLLLPLWVATGLLAPIVTGYPLQLVGQLLGGSKPVADNGDPFLHEWVFGVVYTGFGVQALALGGLFALYARDRWGVLLTGRLRDLPGTVQGLAVRRTFGVVAAVLALLVGGVHAMWAVGADAGLSPYLAGHRTTTFYLNEGLDTLWCLAAAAAAVVVAFPALRPAARVRTVVALGWTGGATVAAWGGWLLLASLLQDSVPGDGKQLSQLMNVAYAGQMITGVLLLLLGAQLLAERAAAALPASVASEAASEAASESAASRQPA